MTVLVTGATGNVGRLVVDHLVRAGVRVRALTTNPAKAALPPEVEVCEGYLGRLDTMPAALDGVELLYLAPLARTVREVADLAVRAGVRRIVDLSQVHADDEAEQDESEWHYLAVERAVEASGVEWTHLRPGEFFTNALGWADQVREKGVVRAPYGKAAHAAIDLDDIAAVAATVLLEDGHHGRKYPLTGPQTLTRAEQVAIIGEVLGTPVRFEEQPRDEARQEMVDAGFGDAADWLLDTYAHAVEHPQAVLPTFTELTGRPGTTFAQWVAANADAFR